MKDCISKDWVQLLRLMDDVLHWCLKCGIYQLLQQFCEPPNTQIWSNVDYAFQRNNPAFQVVRVLWLHNNSIRKEIQYFLRWVSHPGKCFLSWLLGPSSGYRVSTGNNSSSGMGRFCIVQFVKGHLIIGCDVAFIRLAL